MNDLVEILEELDDKLDCHPDEIELSITDLLKIHVVIRMNKK